GRPGPASCDDIRIFSSFSRSVDAGLGYRGLEDRWPAGLRCPPLGSTHPSPTRRCGLPCASRAVQRGMLRRRCAQPGRCLPPRGSHGRVRPTPKESPGPKRKWLFPREPGAGSPPSRAGLPGLPFPNAPAPGDRFLLLDPAQYPDEASRAAFLSGFEAELGGDHTLAWKDFYLKTVTGAIPGTGFGGYSLVAGGSGNRPG